MAIRTSARWLSIGVPLVALLASCQKVTSDNVQLWKTTEKGPGKLVDALGNRAVDPKLRAEAAVALVDIGKADDVDAKLANMEAGDRWEIIRPLIPLYATNASDPMPAKSLAFRDALFSLRPLSPTDEQKRIDEALLPGIEKEIRTGRVRNGRHSVDKILTAMGAPAATLLANLLGEPIVGYHAAAELLAKIGDDAARDKGAANLVERAKRERPVPDALWKSIGLLGGPTGRQFLEQKVVSGNKLEATAAVRALQQRRDPAVLELALRTAADPKADRLIRDEMFGVIETIGGLEARDGLVKIIQTDKDELVRYRSFESVLTVAKADGIVPALEAFPASATYKKVDVEDLLVKLIEKLGQPARPHLVKALESKYPLARMTAAMTLEQIGKAEDAAALEALAKDTTAIKGFPAGETIGKVATRAAGAVKSKA